MNFKASSIHLGCDEDGYYFSWVDRSDSVYRSVSLNFDQVILLLTQSADLVQKRSQDAPQNK